MKEKDCRKINQQLEREQRRFRIAIESTSAIVFEYDIKRDKYHAFGTLENARDKHGSEREFDNFAAKYLPEIFHRDYRESVWNLLQGNEQEELEVRMVPYYGSSQMVWAKISAQVIFDEAGDPVSVIGKIRDIQSEKEKEFALWEAKAKDSLTGLLSREYGIRAVQEYLENKPPEQICALMLLDMDDFSRFNKERGEHFAQIILQDVADVLKEETGRDDILLRLGGDEFMMLVKDCTKEKAVRVGEKIADRIRHLLPSREVFVSASIGMCSTIVVEEYVGLYRCAESTLKYVKEHGKGQAACYLDTSNELGTVLTQLYPEKYMINEIGGVAAGDRNITSFALDLLGKANNINDAMPFLLARVGKILGLDRVLVMEVDYEYLEATFPHQWERCAKDRMNAKMLYLEEEMFSHIFEENKGIADFSFGGKAQMMPSCIYEIIGLGENYAGALIFERNDGDNIWSGKERKILKELSKAIGSFLMKAKTDALMKAKTEFLSRVSHEIRTPMNAIVGMTAIAQRKIDDKEAVRDCLKKIEAANESLIRLVEGMLDMTQMENGRMMENPESLPQPDVLREEEPQPAKKQEQLPLNVQETLCGQEDGNETEEAAVGELAQEEADGGENNPDGGTWNFHKERILIVEDNTLNREIVDSILKIHGLTTESADNGNMALEAFSSHEAGYYDGILMDIRMPVMDGLEATRRIRTLGRKDSRTVPIIALTANAFDEDTNKSIECGMNGHLSKPINVQELLSLLQKEIMRKKETEEKQKAKRMPMAQ